MFMKSMILNHLSVMDKIIQLLTSKEAIITYVVIILIVILIFALSCINNTTSQSFCVIYLNSIYNPACYCSTHKHQKSTAICRLRLGI